MHARFSISGPFIRQIPRLAEFNYVSSTASAIASLEHLIKPFPCDNWLKRVSKQTFLVCTITETTRFILRVAGRDVRYFQLADAAGDTF